MTLARSGRSARARRYPLNQCALYKLGSKAKLAELLRVDIGLLLGLRSGTTAYRCFEQPAATCEFTGAVTKARGVQEPLGWVKAAQSRLVSLLSRTHLPEYCHGATSGRSYRTNAAAHVAGQWVATFDIKSFFPSTPRERVFWFFRDELICAPDVANLLADLCTFRGTLPTGAPSSPLISFFANQRLFDGLSDLAANSGLVFTVYIDDLTFSGLEIPPGFVSKVRRVVEAHGHTLSLGKTHVFGPASPKHVTGTVLEGGQLKVPHSRFLKARRIAEFRKAAADPVRRLQLSQKLSGLLGEAAYLDSRFRPWAVRSYEELAAARAAAESARDLATPAPGA